MSRTSIYNKNLSGTKSFNDGLGSLIQNGNVETNEVDLNGDLFLSGAIINGSNYITFNEQYQYTDFNQNVHIYGTGLINYQDVTYNIGQILSAFVGGGTISPYPSITYNSSTGETSFTGILVFQNNAISSSAINNIDFATISTSQTLSNKSFSGTTIFSSIQLNSDLILNSGGLTLSNANLQNIQYLTNINSDLNARLNTDEGNINILTTKLTNVTFNSSTTNITSTLASSIFTFSTSINGATKLVFDNTMLYCNSLTANVQDSLNTLNTDLTTAKNNIVNLQFLTTGLSSYNSTSTTSTYNGFHVFPSLTLSGSLNLNNSVILSNAQLQDIPSIGILITKTQNISSPNSSTTTIANTTNISELNITGNVNGYSNSQFNNVLLQCNSLSSNCQQQITTAQNKADSAYNSASDAKSRADSAYNLASGAQGTASSALTLAGTANGLAVTAGGVAATALTSANTANSVNATQQTAIDNNITDITTLKAKTFSISRNATTNVTSINGTLSTNTLRLTDLDSGINQITTNAITFGGYTTINNTLYLGNYGNIIVDGIVNQTSITEYTGNSNQFSANSSFLGNVTTSGSQTSLNSTNTQIGTNTISTLTINSNTTCNGDFTMLSNKNLRLKNILPIILDDILFGDYANTYADSNVVFNMKIIANKALTLNANVQQGTNASRYTYLSYNDNYSVYANNTLTLSSPTISITGTNTTITDTATLSLNAPAISIGNVLGINTLLGQTVVSNLYSTTGIITTASSTWQF